MPISRKIRGQKPLDRRDFLQRSAAMVALSCGIPASAFASSKGPMPGAEPFDVKTHPPDPHPQGAVYIPARAYNAFQMWRDYDPKITQRDAQYAHSLRLNAFRLWLSYEFWQKDRQALRQGFENLLQVCSARGIRIMPVLFEGVGVEPTPANLVDTVPLKGSAVLSPSSQIVKDHKQWRGPREYVDWFMDHFRNDKRLLAIEVQNEPHTVAREIFAREMVMQAAKQKGSVPLTLGGTKLRQSLLFVGAGVDILESHDNFPPSAAFVRKFIQSEIVNPEKVLQRPVWLTEWQRIRPSGSGWGSQPLQGNEWEPDYASMAPIVKSSGIGNFFWSLMLKPAYLIAQREKGSLNGVFHEDGAVWSLADARAISRNPRFEAEERKTWPEWAKSIPATLKIGAP